MGNILNSPRCCCSWKKSPINGGTKNPTCCYKISSMNSSAAPPKTNNFWKLEMISNKKQNLRHKCAVYFSGSCSFSGANDAQRPCDFEDSGLLNSSSSNIYLIGKYESSLGSKLLPRYHRVVTVGLCQRANPMAKSFAKLCANECVRPKALGHTQIQQFQFE